MTIVNANRVRENTTGNGTGALALLGAVRNFQTFSAGVGNGNQCYYAITHQTANEWEVGLGTFTLSGGIPYLARNTVYSSSNGNTLVDFSSGTKQAAVVFPGTQIDTIASNVGVAAGYANDALTYSNLASTAAVNANIYRVSAAADASLAGVYAAAASASYVDAASAAAYAASVAAQVSSVATEASLALVAASLAQLYKTSASAYATEAGGYASVAQIYKVSASAFATDAANYASIAGVRANTASIAVVSAAADASAAAVSKAAASAYATNAADSASAALVYLNSAAAHATSAAADASLALIYRTSASAYATQAADSASLAAYYASIIQVGGYARLSATQTFTGANTFTSAVNVRSALSVTGNFFVSGVTTLASAVDVKGATSLASTLVVNGNATFNSTVSVSSAVVVGPGAAGTPSISTTGDTNTGIYFPAANTLAASTAGSERMRIDSAGNVGIGTTSPAYKLDVNGEIRIPNATVIWMNDSSGVAKQTLQLFSDNNTYMSTPGALILRTNGTTERMRIDASGNVGIGGATSIGGTLITTGNATFSGTVSVSGNFVTSGANTFTSIVNINGPVSVTDKAGFRTAINITSATQTSAGLVRLADTSAVLAGVDTERVATPDGINATMSRVQQISKSAAYEVSIGDAGRHILHPSSDTTARTFTIPSNTTVAFALGTAITFVNQVSAGTLTIAITTDTMYLAGDGSTGSRTLTAPGIATALKIATTQWIISGAGLT